MKIDIIGKNKTSTDPAAQRAPFVRRGPQTYRILKVLWFIWTGLRFVIKVTILHISCEILE
jgi:flavin-binding protein dodecin